MIGYAMLGTNDIDKASAFYDELLALVGAKRTFSTANANFWGSGMGKPMLGIGKPFDKEQATVGNGSMLALATEDQASVEKIHAKAIALGGQCEGEPGFRTDNFYGAYFRDLDGNKLAIFCMSAKS